MQSTSRMKAIISALAAVFLAAGIASAQTVAQADSARVYFSYGESNFDPSYRGNGAAIDALVRIAVSHDSAPECVIINSSTSPEGPIDANERLAAKRQESMLEYLGSRVSLDGIRVKYSDKFTDFALMERLVKEDGAMKPRHKTQVLEKICSDSPFSVNELQRSSAWEYLQGHILPLMRTALIVFVWDSGTVADESSASEEENLAFDVPYEPVPETSEEPEVAPEDNGPEQGPETSETPAASEAPEASASASGNGFTMFPVILKVNALTLPLLVPNLGVEVQPLDHWSISVPVYFTSLNWWYGNRKVRVLVTQPEVRYWLRDDLSGVFFNLHGAVASFDIAPGGNFRYQSGKTPLWDAGIGIGIKKNLGDTRWGLEAGLGLGYVKGKYDYYYVSDGSQAGNGGFDYFGPDQAFVSITYRFF